MMLPKSSTALFEELSYDKNSSFPSKIVSRYCLNKPHSTKQTWHVILDISHSNIVYRPGDSIGICPKNDLQEVLRIMHCCAFTGEEEVRDEKSGQAFSLLEFLLKKANLMLPTKKLLRELVLQKAKDSNAEDLAPLLHADKSDQCRAFLQRHTVFELLQKYPQAVFEPQTFVELLSPLLPRLYSIASSQRGQDNEMHLTVSRVCCEVEGKKRFGVCSEFLCQRAEVGRDEVGIYLQKTRDFVLPECNQTPIIMIGPGTGVAPYRAFMQERLALGSHTHKNWLFFGERQRAYDFFYEEYWAGLQVKGVLRLDTAFSRDQEEKVYVQHQMWQERQDLFKWLEEGALLYVCGDASHMAKDVDAMLQQIVSHEAQISCDKAKAYVSSLRKQKRYLRDVY